MKIRRLRKQDIAAIAVVEMSAPSPWPPALIASELEQKNSLQYVIFEEPAEKNLLGWCCARVVAPDAELLKITVLPRVRRSGAGTLLLRKVLDDCQSAGCSQVFLEVRAQNTGARCFYAHSGFQEQGLRRNYYSDPIDNAVILCLPCRSHVDR